MAEAGSELVRITVNTPEAAAAVPQIRARLDSLGCERAADRRFPLQRPPLLTEFPDCAQVLAKYRINPGNVGRSRSDEILFRSCSKRPCATANRCASA